MNDLNLKNINFNYSRKTPLFSEFSIAFKENGFYSIIGENGSGKSTLLKIIAGALRPSSGSISFKGNNFSHIGSLKKHIGYIPQTYSLDPELTVSDTLFFIGSLQKLEKINLRDRIHQISNQFELKNLLPKRVKSLSGGQKQLLNIAIGFLHNPDIILLDEPFTGLDFSTKTNVLSCLKKSNKLILCVTHDLYVAQANSDAIILMENGNIKANSHPASLINENPFLLYEVDFTNINSKLLDELDTLNHSYKVSNNRILLYSKNEEPNKLAIESFLQKHKATISHTEYSSDNLYSTLIGKFNFRKNQKTGQKKSKKKRK